MAEEQRSALVGAPKYDQRGTNHKASVPLTKEEQKFVKAYMRTGNTYLAVKEAGFADRSESAYRSLGNRLIQQPNIQAEIRRVNKKIRSATVATAREVMEYFTSVMRGEIKDQFGLEASLSERTNAARELAKRTVDIENRQQGTSDVAVEIKLDWKRGGQ